MFTRMLVRVLNKYIAEWTMAVMSVGKTSTVVRGEFPRPEGGRTGSVSGVSADTRVATKGSVMALTGGDGSRSTGGEKATGKRVWRRS